MVTIDEEWYLKKGDGFADAPWSKMNFLCNLNGKWNNSVIVLQDGGVLGYMIVTETTPQKLHINRIAIRAGNHGIGTSMVDFLSTLAVRNGYSKITAIVSESNLQARNFFLKHDFIILSDMRLKAFLLEKGRKINLYKNTHIFIEADHKYVVVEKAL